MQRFGREMTMKKSWDEEDERQKEWRQDRRRGWRRRGRECRGMRKRRKEPDKGPPQSSTASWPTPAGQGLAAESESLSHSLNHSPTLLRVWQAALASALPTRHRWRRGRSGADWSAYESNVCMCVCVCLSGSYYGMKSTAQWQAERHKTNRCIVSSKMKMRDENRWSISTAEMRWHSRPENDHVSQEGGNTKEGCSGPVFNCEEMREQRLANSCVKNLDITEITESRKSFAARPCKL